MKLYCLTGAYANTIREFPDDVGNVLIDKARARRLDPEEVVALEVQAAEQAEIARAAEPKAAKETKKAKAATKKSHRKKAKKEVGGG